MQRLVALDLAGGPAFVAALEQAWDEGDAILPVDPRLPAPARARLLAATRPHRLVTAATTEPQLWEPEAPLLDPGDALVVTTSGSTGDPKALVHTHASLRAHALAVHEHLAVDPQRDRWLACLPLAHLGGLGVVLRAVLTGTPLDVVAGFDAAAVASAPARLGTTLTSLVPTALDRVDAAPYRWVVLGGSGDATSRPANVVHTYGLTETGGGIVYGGVPLPGAEVRVGAAGAISLRGPMLARGRRAPDGTVAPIVDDDGWLATGDLGRWRTEAVDAAAPAAHDGPHGRWLWVDGRADDLIVTGGENVWPAVVEAALATHPAVAEAAVVGRPDPRWGQAVSAFVVAADPSRPPSLAELRDHVRATLPAPAAPHHLTVVAALPRTALGKVRRAELTGADDGGGGGGGASPERDAAQ